jgi:hypothetical protein
MPEVNANGKTHSEHMKAKRGLWRDCCVHDITFGGKCFNCGWVPKDSPYVPMKKEKKR